MFILIYEFLESLNQIMKTTLSMWMLSINAVIWQRCLYTPQKLVGAMECTGHAWGNMQKSYEAIYFANKTINSYFYLYSFFYFYFWFQLDINIFKPVPYHCPGKSYVCGYSRVPMDKHGNVQVKCCTGIYLKTTLCLFVIRSKTTALGFFNENRENIT